MKGVFMVSIAGLTLWGGLAIGACGGAGMRTRSVAAEDRSTENLG